MFGFLNIYKPKGMTSHDVVAMLRKITKIKQIGHTGTLDPFAEGVLPVCIGKATRLIEYLEDDKEYLATVQFGKNTTTYDIEGEVTECFENKITQNDLELALDSFRGEIEQLPPIYSAIKVNGKKLYEYARKGETVEIKPRKVTISKLELKCFDYEKQTAELLIACSKGTYIRSIAYDLGQKLKCGGYLTKLIRTKAGNFTLDKANLISDNLVKINPLDALNLEKIEISDFDYQRVLNGNFIDNSYNVSSDKVLLTKNNKLVSIANLSDNLIKPKKVFKEDE